MNWNTRYAAGKSWPHPLDEPWNDRLWQKTQEGENGGGVYQYRGFGEIPEYGATIRHWVFSDDDGTERHEATVTASYPGESHRTVHYDSFNVDGLTLPELKQHAERTFKIIGQRKPDLVENLRKYWGQ